MSKYFTQPALPTADNKYYISTTGHGWSRCCLGNSSIVARQYKYSVLPNCVGWAIGRFNEIAKTRSCVYAISGDAGSFVKNNTMFKTGMLPREGAMIVWTKSNAYGHVGIVEKVNSTSSIVISESGWSSKRYMWTATHTKGTDGNWTDGDDASWMKGKYRIAGFIYNPDIPATDVDGYWGPDTTLCLQNMLGTTVDGFISYQKVVNTIFVTAPCSSIKFTNKNASGSECVKALQKLIGAEKITGQIDNFTILALQRFLTKKKVYSGSISGILDKETVIGLQKYINNYYANKA